MAVWYIDSVAYAAVTAWATATAKTAGNLVRATAPAVNNERVFVCIVAGTTNATTEPTWVLTKGAKTNDAAPLVWMECTGQAGLNGDLTNCPLSSSVRSTTPAQGVVIQNNAGTFLFIVTTSGACGAGEPTYNTTAGLTTTDGGCTWTSLGAVGGFTAYNAPHARLFNAYASGWGAAGDIFYIGDDHAETQAAAMTLTSPSSATVISPVLCVDHTKAAPGSGDLKTTATVTTTGANALTLTGGYYNGVIFNSGSGANNPILTITPAGQRTLFENCSLRKLGTVANGIAITFNGTTVSAEIDLINTTMQFGNTVDSIGIFYNAVIKWRDTPAAILGSIPLNLFYTGNGSVGGVIEIENVDLSALGSSTLYQTSVGTLVAPLINCKLGSGYVLGVPGVAGGRIDLINCDSGATNYIEARSAYEGSHIIETALVRTAGDSVGGTAISWKIVTLAPASWYTPFECRRIPIKNSVLSTNRVVTIAGIWNSASLPNNDDIWLEVRYLGSATSPLGSKATQTKASGLAANAALPADTSAWDSNITARANTNAYSVGNVIKVASNAGRVFFCTVAGTSAGSEPAGYASGVDGGVVTDGGATFRAGMRFKLTATLSSPQPAQTGYVFSYVKVAKASSTFWIDPLNTLS